VFKFANNATRTLASATTASYLDEALVMTGTEVGDFAYMGPGDTQVGTLTDPSLPGQYEIVVIRAISGNIFTVTRGAESTLPVAWPAGAKLEARVTAAMLDSFLQLDYAGNGTAGTNGSNFAINGVVPNDYVPGGTQQIGGWPIMRVHRRKPDLTTTQDTNFTHEVMGATHVLSIGAPAVFNTSTNYSPHDVVRLSASTAYQYTYAPLHPLMEVYTKVSPSAGVTSTIVVGGSTYGHWLCTPNPVDVTVDLALGPKNGLMVTEVGFLWAAYAAVSSTPVVSIGTSSNATRFASSVPLSQLSGLSSVHRIPVTTGGALASDIRFTVVTPASGQLIGRFYWRGVALAVI